MFDVTDVMLCETKQIKKNKTKTKQTNKHPQTNAESLKKMFLV